MDETVAAKAEANGKKLTKQQQKEQLQAELAAAQKRHDDHKVARGESERQARLAAKEVEEIKSRLISVLSN